MPVDKNMTESDKQPQKVQTGRGNAPTEASKSEVKVVEPDENAIPQSYVWLANGEVLLANDEDLPGASGAQNPHGHWVKDGLVYEIVGVYPKEVKGEE